MAILIFFFLTFATIYMIYVKFDLFSSLTGFILLFLLYYRHDSE